jgi:hypothetical protein
MRDNPGSVEMNDFERLMERVGPYLSDLDAARELLREALEKEDPESFLEERLRSSSGLLKGDIRIIINGLRQ